MARKLTKLKISEVSSVSAGAGEGVAIKLLKRNDSRTDFAKIFGAEPSACTGLRNFLDEQVRKGALTGKLGKASDVDDDEEDGDDEDEVTSTPARSSSSRRRTNIMNVSDLIAELQRISPRGRALMASIKRDDDIVRKDQQMTRSEKLIAIGKSYSAATIAQQVIKQRDAGLSEAEVVKMFTASIKRRPNESSAQAFSRVYSSAEGLALRAATKAVRDRGWLARLGKQGGPPGAGGATAEDEAADSAQDEQQDRGDTSGIPSAGGAGSGPGSEWSFGSKGAGASALGQLNGMAAELRKRDPSLTQAQAFARVYEAPSSVALRNKERAQSRARLGAR